MTTAKAAEHEKIDPVVVEVLLASLEMTRYPMGDPRRKRAARRRNRGFFELTDEQKGRVQSMSQSLAVMCGVWS